jgi:hypothetical protein
MAIAAQAHSALVAQRLKFVRIASELAAFHGALFRQQTGKRPDCGRLRCPPVTADQDPANRRIDRVQEQRELHALLADDSAKGVGQALY